MRFTGRIALVTGGGRGIGAEIARSLAREGATIAVSARTESEVKKVVEEEYPEKGSIPIEVTSSNDLRSYHINSGKIKRALGFEPSHTVEDAVRGLCAAFKQGKLPDSFTDDRYHNVRTMKASGIK